MTVLQNSLAAAVLIAVIVLVRAATLHRVPKNTFCVLWIAAALRLLLPFSIESRFSFFTLLIRKQSSGTAAAVPYLLPAEVSAETAAIAQRPIPVAAIVWLAGVCAMAGFFLASYVRAARRFKRSVPVDDGRIDPADLRLPRRIQLRQAKGVAGPLTFGLFRPVILLPETTGWEDPENLSFILIHEYTHIRRRDCVTKLLFVAALCVHWFNPMVWLMCWLANRDIELACDEQTIRACGADSRIAYARVLLGQAERASCGFLMFSHFGKHAVQERITAVLKQRRRSAGSVVLACLAVAGTLAVFGTGAKAADRPGSGLSVGIPWEGQNIFDDAHIIGSTIGFISEDPDEVCSEIRFTTLEGETYYLKPDQSFFYDLRNRWVKEGYVWGFLMERDKKTGNCDYVMKKNGQKTLLRADFAVLETDPAVIYTVGEKKCVYLSPYSSLGAYSVTTTSADRPDGGEIISSYSFYAGGTE